MVPGSPLTVTVTLVRVSVRVAVAHDRLGATVTNTAKFGFGSKTPSA